MQPLNAPPRSAQTGAIGNLMGAQSPEEVTGRVGTILGRSNPRQ